jgi:hypothetical protein
MLKYLISRGLIEYALSAAAGAESAPEVWLFGAGVS